MSTKKICIIGSGNWGSAIAKIIGGTVTAHPETFDSEVKMWVFEELIDGEKLTDIINSQHENVKYLPGRKLPENIVAVPDIIEAANDADYLIIVLPHQFIARSCAPLKGKLKADAQVISLVKGFDIVPGGGIRLISDVIKEIFGEEVPVSVLMGANIAHEVADNKFCETTIGSSPLLTSDHRQNLFKMFNTANFRVTVVTDAVTVEICGALKNIVACGAGFVDGLRCGDNTKAAVIRLGLMEMIKFTELFYQNTKRATFLESCGVADLITTCYGGRNRKVSEAFVTSGKTIEELESEMLGGQKLQGPETAAEVNFMLKAKGMEDQFPLFTAVHHICKGEKPVDHFLNYLHDHPEHQVE